MVQASPSQAHLQRSPSVSPSWISLIVKHPSPLLDDETEQMPQGSGQQGPRQMLQPERMEPEQQEPELPMLHVRQKPQELKKQEP